MKTIFEIIGWFLGLIVKLVVGLFSLIFKGIASLFSKDNGVARKAVKE